MPAAATLDLTATIAGHCHRAGQRGVPGHALHAARRSLLDTLGIMSAATGLADETKPYRDGFGLATAGPCRVIGKARGRAPLEAALANGALAHALDFGDTFDRGAAHPHAALVPALLALVDLRPDITMDLLLKAIAVGADLACRLSLAPMRAFEEGGWYAPALVNPPATAAAAAMLLDYDTDEIAQAIGLSLFGAAFPDGFKGDAASPLRAVREAFGARAGLEAALLAASGARAFADPLGGKGGFFASFGGGWRAEPLLADLGDEWLGAEVSFKQWPSCRGTHAYIEAALALRGGIDLAKIACIEIIVGPLQEVLAEPLVEPDALTPSRAKFSIRYTLAAALVDGRVDFDTFAPGRLADPALHALAALVEPKRDPAWTRSDAARGEMAVILDSGVRHEMAIKQARGSPGNPLGDAALTDKFVHCLSRAAKPVASVEAEVIAALILQLDLDRPAAELLEGLCG